MSGIEEEVGQCNSIRKVISLKDNCFDCILKNFDRFNKASEDSALGRNLEYLQRVYSSHIIQSLSTKALLHEQHLDFLINEHLKEFDLRIFLKSRCSLKSIEKRIALVGHGFEKVSFDFPYIVWDNSISEFLNAAVCHLTNVEVLHILNKCNNTTLRNISLFCTKLSELNIDGSSDVTLEGLKMLCEKREEVQTECLIKKLFIRDISLLHSAITFLLNNMAYLEVVNYNNLPIILHSMHKEDLRNNTLNRVKKYNLTKLDFFNSSSIFNDREDGLKAEILQVWAEVCPNIKTVFINLSSKHSLDLISRFSNLEDFTVGSLLDVAFEKRIEFNTFLKSSGIKLRNLRVYGFFLSIPILIESCPKLQNLVFTDVQFQPLEKNLTKGQLSNKKNLQNLSNFCLVNIKFSDQYAEASVTTIILSSPNIRRLSFQLCKFENSGMNTKLAKYCEDRKLQHMRFYECNIDMALLESIILTCSSLLSLTIDSCENIRSNEALNLYQLRDTAKSFVKIVYTQKVYTNDESDESENSANYSSDDHLYDDVYIPGEDDINPYPEPYEPQSNYGWWL